MAGLLCHVLGSSGTSQLLETLTSFLNTGESNRDVEYYSAVKSLLEILQERDGLSDEITQRVFHELCLPVIHSQNAVSPSERHKIFVVYEIIVISCAFGTKHLLLEVSDLCLKGLSHFINGEPHMEQDGRGIPVDICFDLIGYLLKYRFPDKDCCLLDHEMEERFFKCLLAVLEHTNELTCAKITGVVLPEFFSCDNKLRQERIEVLWRLIKNISAKQVKHSDENTKFYPSFSILCGLASFFFGVNIDYNIVLDPEFWLLIQKGLVIQDPLTRKRAMYLMKITLDFIEKVDILINVEGTNSDVLFFWDPKEKINILETWQEFVLLWESLDESQVHVVIPVLPRISKIIAATCRQPQGLPSLSVSWLTTILFRASQHDNKSIRKWAILELLTIDLEACPLLEKNNWPFLLGPFQKMLNEYRLYAREDDSVKGDVPVIGNALQTFYARCLETLPSEQHIEFLQNLIAAIDDAQFCAAPLLFVSKALASIPSCQVWDADSLQKVRSVIIHLGSHPPSIRVCITGFLLKAATRLTRPTLVTWENFLHLLSSTIVSESLIRGSWLWKELSQWLWSIESHNDHLIDVSRNSIESESIRDFLISTSKAYLEDAVNDGYTEDELHALVCVVIASSDSWNAVNGSQAPKRSPLKDLMEIVLNTITHATTHIYAPERKGYRAVEFLAEIFCVINLPGTANNEEINHPTSSIPPVTSELLCSCLKASLTTILSLLERKMLVSSSRNSNGKDGYLTLCKALYTFLINNPTLSTKLPEFYRFTENITRLGISNIQSLQEIEHLGVKEFCTLHQSMAVVSWAYDVVSIADKAVPLSLIDILQIAVPSFRLNVNFTKPVSSGSRSTDGNNEDLSSFEWSHMVSDYVESLLDSVCIFLSRFSFPEQVVTHKKGRVTVTSPSASLLDCVWGALDIAYFENYPAMLRCLTLVLPKVIEDADLSAQILERVRRIVQDTRETEFFWKVLDEAVTVMFCPDLLKLPEDHPLTVRMKAIWKEMLKYGTVRVGVMVKVIQQLSKTWESFDDVTRAQSLYVHRDIIFDACVFGPALEKSKHTDNDVMAYLCNHGNESSLDVFKTEDWRDDSHVRVTMLNTLLSLDPSKPQNLKVLKDVIGLFLDYDLETLKEKTRCFLSSPYHRKKHRVWQVILVLISVVIPHDNKDSEFASEVLKTVLTCLSVSSQTTIRNYQEWTVLHIIYRHLELLSTIWEEMTFDNKKVGRITSLITIATLLILHRKEGSSEIQEGIINRAIITIFPWAMTNHRGVRCYAHVAILRIWSYCSTEGFVKVLKEDAFLKSCIQFMEKNNDNGVEKKRVLEDYFFFDVSLFKDFSIESIYHIIPRLSGITDEELISPYMFKETPVGMRVWKESTRHGIPLYNPDRSQTELVVHSYEKEEGGVSKHVRLRVAGIRNVKQETAETLEDDEGKENPQNHGDVQKKIIAWKIVPPDELLVSELQEQRMVTMQRTTGGDLVVVASLIDKAPNLGGLCRTCEIFGVRKLVIGSNDVMNQPQFKNLSVSSAKWVDVEQVRPADLKPYLQAMRKEGYTVIGVEQTANSHCLTEYRFPHNALLLLGHEKHGIPVELIQVLDACVEIPQVGIIRSLNVHVSGALLIWEYTRQRILGKGHTAVGK